MGKIGCVAIVKNEERHIAEWIAWQLLIGFDTVILLDNGSTDRTKDIAASFVPRYDVRVIDWFDREKGTQQRAYMHAVGALKGEFEWLAFFDADEFLVLDEGLGLKALLRQRPEAAIGVPWAMFGSSGHKDYPPGLMIEDYTNRAPDSFGPNAHVKSILRPQLAKRAYNPHAFEIDGHYVSLKGKPLTFGTPGVLAKDRAFDGVKLHHYFTRSWAHWQDRLKRGNLGGLRTEQQFYDYDRNEVPDHSATRHAPRVRAMIEELKRPQAKPGVEPARKPGAGKVAVVLAVKDEKDDILPWLAWYRLLGFDAAIVYDDDSTDGTWEILEAAAQRWDIRLSRAIGPRGVTYERRQGASYTHALETHKNEFAWLAFFDADEYLQLRQDKDVHDFLACFPDADQVAVNWCNYSSSGHILKPELPAPLAYHLHKSAQRPVNKHVKCFVRPGNVGPRWYNVHCFDVAPERALLANGQPVRWSETRGIIADTPDWSVAKLMHYQCRSMEHLVERLRKRPELKAVSNIWTAYNIHDEEDTAPLAQAEALEAAIADLAPPRREAPRADTVPAEPAQPVAAHGEALPLGIAITTLNRREMVLEQVETLRRFTNTPFELVICDDGSIDGTVEALRERGETVIAGPNRGVAWNKNRGLYYLTAIKRAETVILLDDDVLPMADGWEREWIEAARLHGHINHIHPIYYTQLVSGEMTAASPGLLPVLGGSVLAFHHRVLAQLGFMDPRFGRYGHEHTELTQRAIRAGFGGVVLKEEEGERILYFAIKGRLEALPVPGVGSPEDIAANGKIFEALRDEPIHRHAWRDDAQMREFLGEIAQVVPLDGNPWPLPQNRFASLEAYRSGAFFPSEWQPNALPLTFLIGETEPALIDEALAKEGKVVAVQPDARLYYLLAEHFSVPVAEGRLALENFAPAPRGGEIAMLHPADGSRPYPVATISWEELVAKHGRPTSVKMGAEIPGYPAMAV